MRNRRPISRLRAASLGLTLIEVMIAVGIIGIVMIPSLSTIQLARIRSRAVGVNLIGQNICVAMMELIKRSGYDEVAYGETLPGILDTSEVPSPLLDFPRTKHGSSTEEADIPSGAPGGVTESAMESFLVDARDGEVSAGSAVLTNDANYYFFSADQIAAMNGYDSAADVPDDVTLLNPQYAWGVFISDDPAGSNGGAIGYPVKRVAVIVKWIDPRRNRRDFTVLESAISLVAPRM